jgi:hypothetical protein
MRTILSPSEITDRNDASPIYELGCEVTVKNGKTYKYVKVTAVTVATTAGKLAYFSDTTGYGVTAKISEALGVNFVAGVFTKSAVSVNCYTFVQVGGIVTLATDAGDDITKNDPLIAHASTDGTVDRITAASVYRVVAYAMADDSNSADTVLAMLVLATD